MPAGNWWVVTSALVYCKTASWRISNRDRREKGAVAECATYIWNGCTYNALCLQRWKASNRCGVVIWCVARFVEENGVLAEFGELSNPLIDIGGVERLYPDAGWVNTLPNECLHEVSRIIFLGIASWVLSILGCSGIVGERFELRGEVAITRKRANEVEVALECLDGSTGVVELCSPGWDTVLVVCDIGSTRVKAVHLRAEGQVFGGCDVGGTADSVGRSSGVCWREGEDALCREGLVKEDIGGGMQIAKRVSANEALIGCESGVTFEDAGAHSSSSHGILYALFWDLERCAATVTDGEISDLEWPVLATHELGLERRVGHVLDEVEGARTKRDVIVFFSVLRLELGMVPGSRSSACELYYNGRNGQAGESRTHLKRVLGQRFPILLRDTYM